MNGYQMKNTVSMGKPINSIISGILVLAIAISSCTKSPGSSDGPYQLHYADSIVYLKPQSTDYIVSPVDVPPGGSFTAFPDGIEIDDRTGAINVSKSETGLRYRITYTSAAGDASSTMIVLSGITFLDKFYHLSQNDSVAFPVYNASVSRTVPLTGSDFDEGNTANSGGCSVKTTNGQINLRESIRNGIFGNTPQNDVRKDFDIQYRINDGSDKSLNKLRVRLYYYATMNDVPADLWETLNDRISQGVFLGMNNMATGNQAASQVARETSINGLARPRPPCIIIVGQ